MSDEENIQQTAIRYQQAIKAIFGVMTLHRLTVSAQARCLAVALANLLREVSPPGDLKKFVDEAKHLIETQAFSSDENTSH